MKTHEKNNQAGFTLIESIVALVVAAIMGSMIYTYFGSALTQSSVPIFRLQKVSNLYRVMENIVADYNRMNALNLRYHWQPSTYYGLGSVITPKDESKKNGHYYICTAVSGTGESGTLEPTWTTTGTQPADGGITWAESGNTVASVWQKDHTYTANTIVLPVNNNGHYYICAAVSGTGKSGTLEPTWTTTGTQPADGGITWAEAGTILEKNNDTPGNTFTNDNLSALIPAVNGTSTLYGTGYTVTEKAFIRFNPSSTPPNQETSSALTENNILKVTIKNNDSAETLTQLFTIR